MNPSKKDVSESGSESETGSVYKADSITNECLEFIKQISKALSCLMEYKLQMRTKFQSQNIQAQLNRVFCDIKSLQNLYDSMFDNLTRQRIDGVCCLPDLFLNEQVRGSIDVYKTFLSQYAPNAKWLGAFVRDNPVYEDICIDLTAQRASLMPIRLDSCYYTVFNSLFAFSMLINRYSKCFDVDHESRMKAEEVEKLISTLLNDINVNQKQVYLTQKELNLLTGKSKDPKIDSKFMYKTTIMIYNKKNVKISRQIVLFSDCIYLTSMPRSIFGTSHVQSELSWTNMTVSVIGDTRESTCVKYNSGLNLDSPEGSYNIFFEDVPMTMKWKSMIQSAINNFTKTCSLSVSKVGKNAPQWQKLNAVGYCNGWNCTQKFSPTTRRHHCRADGLIYCDNCFSPHKVKLAFSSNAESKVCQLCYRILVTDILNPSSLAEAKKNLDNVFRLKTRQGAITGWIQERIYNRDRSSFDSPCRFFGELDATDPYINLFERHEDKFRHHGIILVGMTIKTETESRYYGKLKPYEFIIEHQDKDEAYLFRMETGKMCMDWIKCMQTSMDNFLRK